MFSFLSSKGSFLRQSLFPQSRGQTKLLGAAACTLTASTIGSVVILADANDLKSILWFLPTTLESETESSMSEKSHAHNKQGNNDELFHGQCPKRQMHVPTVPYPCWDYNWDGKMTDDTSLEAFRTGRANSSSTAQKRNDGTYKGSNNNNKMKTRHILLVRHGQYDGELKMFQVPLKEIRSN